uniref:Integrin beta n=1 Tax=Arion vulgaris TaxID=1028688 RepID=A0A0B7BDG7_9EUPU
MLRDTHAVITSTISLLMCCNHLLYFFHLRQNEMVRDSSSQNDNAVQIQPQRVKINTRTRAEHKLTMTFRAANNFPIDIYFLFDNSYSMKDQIKNLAALANDIGQSISTISTNYLMGYGIFQDKVALPYTDTNYEKVKNPCRSQGIKCAPPFEFKHILNMTKNIKEFKEQVEKTEVTGNIDFPEGSIDALVQAIACKSIGWRDVGRKLLIFASNDRFHLAGDGRLAGIAIPNDGKCHLDGAGKYTKELQHDYPSVSQLTDIAEKNEVHIIFAVTQDQVDLFKQLSKRISQSKVERLYNPSDAGRDNIKDIIETKYKEMVSEVEIVHTPVKGVDLKIKAISDICEKKGTNQCKGLSIGTSIRFDVEVIVTECPSNPQDRKKEITIYPESMSNDKLVLDIEIVCECGCNDDQTTWEINSNICNAGNGTLKCGICDCHKDRFGKFCECDSSELGSSNSGCVRPGVNSTVQCSGSGTCECGVCKCFEGFSGTHCECNDKACGNFRREICGGTNGRCVCGNCVCQSEYYGNACECPKSNTSCIYDEKVCNNAGTCECGECKCTIAGYTGKQCENCVLCGDTVCESTNYRRCAECAFLKKDKDCFKDCPETSLVTTLENVQGSAVCSIKQDDGCFLFSVLLVLHLKQM